MLCCFLQSVLVKSLSETVPNYIERPQILKPKTAEVNQWNAHEQFMERYEYDWRGMRGKAGTYAFREKMVPTTNQNSFDSVR